jgi:hypothetical protein
MTEIRKTRRDILFGAGAVGATTIAAACSPGKTTGANHADISSADRLEIAELYSRHFYSLDGLTAIIGGKVDQNWTDTFTADGEFTMVRANGHVLVTARGTEELVKTYATFLHTTRHWMNHLLILPGESGVRGSCYILAMDIKDLPYKIIRTGLYEDQLVKVDAAWKFQARKLILDPSSPD